jgi:hypothetical protein
MAAPSRGLGLVWGAACFQADPFQVHVSPIRLEADDPTGVASPPKRTASFLAESYDMDAPDRGPGPVTFACCQPVFVHCQVSSRATGVTVADVVDAVADVVGTGTDVGVVDEPAEGSVDALDAASPVPPKRTS